MPRLYAGFCAPVGSPTGQMLCLLGFADLHVLVDGEDGVADRRIWRRGSVVRDYGEFAAFAATDFVGVALAFGTRKVHGAGRREFVERDAVAVRSDVGAFGLCDLREVHPNAGEAYGLGGSSTGVGGGHSLEGIEIDTGGDGDRNEESDKGSHGKSVPGRPAARNCSKGQSAPGNNRRCY